MTTTNDLRPIERRVLAMRADGLDDSEIGLKIRKSPEQVARIAQWSEYTGRTGGSSTDRDDGPLNALERRVVALREQGESYTEIGERFRRSGRFIRQVEGLARFRQYRDLLG